MHHSIFALKKIQTTRIWIFLDICFLLNKICAIDTSQDILNQYISVCYLLVTPAHPVREVCVQAPHRFRACLYHLSR